MRYYYYNIWIPPWLQRVQGGEHDPFLSSYNNTVKQVSLQENATLETTHEDLNLSLPIPNPVLLTKIPHHLFQMLQYW